MVYKYTKNSKKFSFIHNFLLNVIVPFYNVTKISSVRESVKKMLKESVTPYN